MRTKKFVGFFIDSFMALIFNPKQIHDYKKGIKRCQIR